MIGLLRVSVSVLVLVWGAPALAADAANGRQLALRWCADCHVVTPEQRRPTTEAPPFEAIARQPGFDANRLAFFLLEPHPKMPSMALSRTEATDIAAYIGSLRK